MVKYALLIGINYRKTEAELKGCINDVHKMRSLLINSFGYSKEDIVLLTEDNKPNLQPTALNIMNQLGSLIMKAYSNKASEIWVHYSGHGSYIKDNSGDEADGQDEVLVPSIRAHVKHDGNFGKVFATIRSYVDNGGDKLEDANLVYQRTFRNLTHAIKELERVFTLGLNNYDVSGLGGDDAQDVDLREYDDLAKTVSLRISLPIVKESDSEGRTSYTTLRKNYGDDHKTETIYLSDSFMVRVNATPLKQEGTVKLVADFTVGSKTVRKEMNIQESRLIGTLYGIINDEFSGIFNVTITSYGE
jgi:hypothetical protein